MTKPARLALGIGAAGLLLGAAGFATGSAWRWLLWWIALACAIAATAYGLNLPGVFGKRGGRISALRALPLLPYLLALRIACWIMRKRRRTPVVSRVAPALWVGGRGQASDVPSGVDWIVDLTCEFSAPRGIRERPGYRCLPILDGHFPPDEDAFLDLLDELAAARGGILIHCESGRGRAPTAAAMLLLRLGAASSPREAIEIVRRGRPWTKPTATDWRFMERIARRLEARQARPA